MSTEAKASIRFKSTGPNCARYSIFKELPDLTGAKKPASTRSADMHNTVLKDLVKLKIELSSFSIGLLPRP